MRRHRVRAWLIAVVFTSLTTYSASAEDGVSAAKTLLLLPSPCDTGEGSVPYVIDDGTLALLRVELSPAHVRVVNEAEVAAKHNGEDVIRLSVCGDRAYLARVTFAGAQDTQTVDLSGLLGGARARTLALVLSGLLSTNETPSPPPPEVERTLERPSRSILDPELKPPPPAPIIPPPRIEIGASAETRTYPAPNTSMYGLRLMTRFPRYVVGAVALLSRKTQEVGVVSLGVVAGAVGYALFRRASQPSLGLDLLGELGATWVSGSAVAASSTERRIALHASAGLSPWLHLRLSQRWITTVALFAGYSRGLQTHVASERVVTSHGPFVGISLGAAFRGTPSQVPPR